MSARFAHALPTILAAVLSPAVCSTLCAAGLDGVLLLRNGNLLEGEIVRSGDRYQVAAEGVLLQVPERQVDSFFPTKSAAYRELRRRVGRFDAGVHIALAKWCLRHEMTAETAQELIAAERLKSDHPLLPALRSQLAAARENGRASSQSSDARQRPPSAPPVVQPELGRESDPTPPQTAAPPTIALREEPDARPLAATRAESQLSDESRAQFVRSIQPMLVNSCTAIGCHEVGAKQEFQLDRLAVTAGSHPAVFERNLAAILSQLGDGRPSDSPLVRMGRQPHGAGARTSTPLRPRQLELLAAWVAEANGVEADPDPPQEPSPDAPSATDVHEHGADAMEVAELDRQPSANPATPGTRVASSEATSSDRAPSNLPTFEELDALDWGESEVKRGAPTQKNPYAPRDPFDAEVFNRLYGPGDRRSN